MSVKSEAMSEPVATVMVSVGGEMNLSDRPTPETDKESGYEDGSGCWKYAENGSCVPSDFARRMQRQRDAAVEALKRIGDLDWPGQFSVEEYANRVLREIEEGK